MKADYPSLILLELNVTNPESHTSMKRELFRLNISRIDVFVGNAGINSTSRHSSTSASSAETTDSSDPHKSSMSLSDSMRTIFETNVIGNMMCVESRRDLLAASPLPLIMFISSERGSLAHAVEDADGMSPYRISKAALNMLAVGVSRDPVLEAAGGVKVLCMHPGWVKTDMGEAGGRVPPVTVEESCAGMVHVLHQAMRQRKCPHLFATSASTTASLSSSTSSSSTSSTSASVLPALPFLTALEETSCVFVNYLGELLPW